MSSSIYSYRVEHKYTHTHSHIQNWSYPNIHTVDSKSFSTLIYFDKKKKKKCDFIFCKAGYFTCLPVSSMGNADKTTPFFCVSHIYKAGSLPYKKITKNPQRLNTLAQSPDITTGEYLGDHFGYRSTENLALDVTRNQTKQNLYIQFQMD